MSTVHERLKQKLAGAKSNYGWKPKNGDNKVLVLPPASRFVDDLDGVGRTDHDMLAYEFHGHYFRVEGRQGEATRCLRDLDKKCPVCAVHQVYAESEDPGLKERARQIKRVSVYVFNILDMNNLAKGVQRWGANWTCWTGIMEVAANAAWGYVYDPRNGVVFNVNLTEKDKTRGGHNSYKVTPEPQRMTVLEVLLSREGGLVALDGLEEQTMEPKTPEDIQTLLDEMGFPPPVSRVSANPIAAAAIPGAGVPRPTAAPAVAPVPPAAPAAAPAPVAAPMPAVAAPAAAPTPVAAPAPAAAPARPIGFTTPQVGVHYDPGPDYQEKVPEEQRPPNSPRCFSDYKPTVHRCQPCPVTAPCQMKMLGIA